MNIFSVFFGKKKEMRVCRICGKEYELYSSKKRKICKACKYKRDAENLRNREGFRIKELYKMKNEFSKNKYLFDRTIIDFEQSPNGRAYIGLAKGPLIKNDKGFGFKGVKLQTENRELIMCLECGRWLRYINAAHLKKHGLTTEEYNQKHGFNKHTAQVSDCMSNVLSEGYEKACKTYTPKQRQLDAKKALKKAWKAKNNGKFKYTMELKNSKGTCPLQLKEAFLNYIHRFKRIPSGHSNKFDRTARFEKIGAIRNQHGSINNYCKQLGLPIRHHNYNYSQYVFADGEVFTHCFKKEPYDVLYKKLLEKCPILKK